MRHVMASGQGWGADVTSPLWLVKLGGSLLAGPDGGPEPWLDAVLGTSGVARLIVPGGGPFADAIRAMETPLVLGPLACHRMAILAMQQYAVRLQELRPTAAFIESMDDIRILRQGRGVGIWLPWHLVGLDPRIEPSWDVTSDSLALHLAIRVGATGLVLVKSAPVPAGPMAASSLAAKGLIDPAMPRLLARTPLPVRALGPGQEGELATILAGGEAGCRIEG